MVSRPVVSRTDARTTRRVAGAAGITLVADLLSKIWALAALGDGDIDVVWKLRFHLVSNTGFAFSTGQGLGPVLGLVAIVIAVLLWRTRVAITSTWATIAVGLVMGGALGNLTDRVFRGSGWLRGGVVDFIDLQFWPVFNIADSAIVVGVSALIAYFLLEDRRRSRLCADD